MAYSIRPFQTADAPWLAELTLAAIVTLATRAYSVKQAMAWAAYHPGAPRFIAGAAKGDCILVAADAEGHPVAYVQMEADGHVDMLYCHPDHAGQGLASALLAAVADAARRSGTLRLFTEASELARPVFARAGYRLLHRRDFTLAIAGEDVPIHNYAMEQHLV